VPWLTDQCGRRWVVIISYSLLILLTIWLMLATDITTLYVIVFIMGTTFGGRILCGISWLIEWQQASKKELVVFVKMVTTTAWIVLITAIFQFGTKHWLVVAAIFITLCFIGTVYVIIYVPESSEYLHGKQMYEDARQNLIRVANQNSVYIVGKNQTAPYSKFKFTQELGLSANQLSKLSPIPGQEDSVSSLDSHLGHHGADQLAIAEEYTYTQYDEYAQSKYVRHIIIMSC
jgi:MFS family permease